jgi:hypothetical protein
MSEIETGRLWEERHGRWENLKRQKIVIPRAFLDSVGNSDYLYLESINAYIYGLPNSSVIQSVRCGEIALRKYLENKNIKSFLVKKGEETRNVDLDDARFIDLIEEINLELYDKDEMHYFRSLHNKIHKNELLTDLDALNTLVKITKQINHLFKFKNVIVQQKCPYKFCGQIVPIEISFESYFIGNEMKTTCNSNKHNAFTRGGFKMKLDGITKFTIEQS